jgi:hypothetical protein
MKGFYSNLFVYFSSTLASPLEVNFYVLSNKDINVTRHSTTVRCPGACAKQVHHKPEDILLLNKYQG